MNNAFRASNEELRELTGQLQARPKRGQAIDLAMFQSKFNGVSPSVEELAELPGSEKLKLALAARDELQQSGHGRVAVI